MNKQQMEKIYNIDMTGRPGSVKLNRKEGTITFHNGVYQQPLSARYVKPRSLTNTGG